MYDEFQVFQRSYKNMDGYQINIHNWIELVC